MTTNTKRTDFGLRVLRARKWAGMTQADLAASVGCRQTNIAEAERRSEGSTLTVEIARVTGVDPEWLATGMGDMCSNTSDAPPVPNVALTDGPEPVDVIRLLAQMLMPLNASKRRAIGSLLQSLSDDPAQSDSVAPDIGYLIGGKADSSNAPSRPPPHRAQQLSFA